MTRIIPLILLTTALAANGAAQIITPPPAIDYITEQGPAWAEVREKGEGTLRVIYVPAGGFAYAADDGRLTGVSVEIVRDFASWAADAHGVRVALDFVAEESWPHFLARVREGEGGVLGLGNVTITEERRRQMRFSPPYLTNVAVLITHDDVANLSSLEVLDKEFACLRPLAFAGTLHEERLRRLAPDADLAFATSNDEIIERVAGGGYFAYVDAYNYFRARERGIPLRRHPVGDDPGEEFGFILPPGSDWVEPLEAFFAAGDGYRRTARYRNLLVEHLGEGVAEALLPEDS
jgi:ABC-type amino acid transport substrate-binding protein